MIASVGKHALRPQNTSQRKSTGSNGGAIALIVLLVSTFSIGMSTGQTTSVQLEWDSNPPEDQVAGYNLYRSYQSGSGYVRLNATLIANTTYTDTTIEAGQTYYYVCTAVNTSDLESGFSNEVPHTVPGGTICPGDGHCFEKTGQRGRFCRGRSRDHGNFQSDQYLDLC